MNALNAPVVSTLARALLGLHDADTMHFQYDVATVIHDDPYIGHHLAAIIRSPLPNLEGHVVPALNLWSGPNLARTMFRLDDQPGVYELFRKYCHVLVKGPVEFYVRWGMAFEPHQQNTLIRIQDNEPTGIILRDLDGTILDKVRVQLSLQELGLRLPVEDWDVMPSFATGGRRLVHALHFAHLAPVMAYLIANAGAEPSILADCVEDVWSEIMATYSGESRKLVLGLRTQTESVKNILTMRLDRTMEMRFS